jgi:MarR family transcriptional regulator, organic hydroperoxide resistance regulator
MSANRKRTAPLPTLPRMRGRVGRGRAAKPKSQTIFVHLDDYLPYLINRVGNLLVQLFSRDLAPSRLSVPMWRVIAVLAERGEQRLIDLSIMTSIDASTLSRLTEAMQRKQLVVRQRSRHSKREVVVSLAARGVELVSILGPIALAYEREMIAGLAASDLASTRRALREMFDRLAKLRARAAREMTEARRQKPLFGKTGKLSGSFKPGGKAGR